ncbi:MAG: NAD-dependent DNA ligase LigA [Cellulosilyticaceae bacterium]
MRNINRIKELITELNQCSKLYYNGAESPLSDKQYDALYDELLKLEMETGIILSNSPTQKVGFEAITNLKKSNHKYPARSLDKTKDVSKFISFIKGNTILSAKLDGMTIVLTYDDGELKSAVTRGNGETGDDITENAKHFANIPLTIPYKETLILRGEAVISYDNFEKINVNGEFKNPRNLVAGTVRCLDSKVVADRMVEWILFKVEEGFEGADSKLGKMVKASALGFDMVKLFGVTSQDGNLSETIDWMTNFCSDEYQYPTDGLVLTYDDIKYSESLGMTSHHPLDSLVLKWTDDTYETTLREVIWQPSRTGLINPVAVFDTVDIDGSDVSKASLFNIDYLNNLKLGIGDTVTVYKANQIIPQIDENLTQSNTVTIPTHCLSCGAKIGIENTGTAQVLMCYNKLCHAKLIGALSHFVSRDAMNIKGLSEETLTKLYNEYNVKYPGDLYHLDQYKRRLSMPKAGGGIGKKATDNLLSAIEESRSCKLENFIYALGIPQVGKSTAKDLAKKFKSIEKFMTVVHSEITGIDGIGAVVAAEIITWRIPNYDIIEQLSSLMVFQTEDIQLGHSNLLSDKTFVITGKVNQFKNRDELKANVELNGGKVAGSVSKTTDYLINNDSTSTTGKNKKALELGVKIITENEYIEMIKLHNQII